MALTHCLVLSLLFAHLAWSFIVNPPQLPVLEATVAKGSRRCNCTGIKYLLKGYICGDPRLGPKNLPRKYPLLDIVDTYDRFGGQLPIDFLKKWWDPTSPYSYMNISGGWIYPPRDGFLFGPPENVSVMAVTTLEPGILLDRFGAETGKYLAAADAPFNQRALPPSNLNTGSSPDYPSDYHVYRTAKPMKVLAGVIAPWFGQPGLGAQFWIGLLSADNKANVLYALQEGYLVKVNKTELLAPGDTSQDPGSKCGR